MELRKDEFFSSLAWTIDLMTDLCSKVHVGVYFTVLEQIDLQSSLQKGLHMHILSSNNGPLRPLPTVVSSLKFCALRS